MSPRVGLTTPMIQVCGLSVLVGCYSLLALRKDELKFASFPDIPLAIDAALSVAMAMVLAFRVNRAYERWWEARILWGTLVNVSRNIAVKVHQLVSPNEADRKQVRDTVVAFCYGLKDHLHDDPQLDRLPGFENDPYQPKHLPSHVVGRLYSKYEQWQTDGQLSDQQLWVLDSDTRVLLDVCGGCERIKTTLMSVSWRFFTWQCIVLYLLFLPWGLIDDFGVWTVPLTTLTAYFVMAGEGIAHYVEEPFGPHEDHLDLESMCQTIDRSVSEALGVSSDIQSQSS